MASSSLGNLVFWTAFLFSLSLLAELKAAKCLHPPQTCGSMVIPYPFRMRGKADSCGLSGFEIICKQNASFGTSEPVPFLPLEDLSEVRILNISYDHLLFNSTQFYATSCNGLRNATGLELPRKGPFRISNNNTFITVGCDSLGLLGMYEYLNDILYSGCVSVCNENPTFSDCNGNGCCETPVPSNYTRFSFSTAILRISPNPIYNGTCGYSAVIDKSNWASVSGSSIRDFKSGDYQMRLDWAILNDTCSSAKAKNSSYQCASNADCEDREWGYICKCRNGYKGDGYSNGTACEDFDECSAPEFNNCYDSSKGGGCRNTVGSYECFCVKGSGDGTRNGTRCSSHSHLSLAIAIGVSVTLVAVLVGGATLLWIRRRRRAWLAKKKNFRRNGGLHLQRLISSQAEEAMTVFSLDEIEKATNNFSQSLILGAGGYGTVYKGTLPEGIVVAIKKSKSIEVDPKEIDQFINEVVILSQINHRNIVKLLGCCLETPVPLLVYEYISNGTLFDHLFEDKYEQHLQWEDRLRIATETAEALSYLHSAASIPIVHRDVKTSNILLDDGYTPKVADFGVSRLVPLDQTHITTVVQGTLGYLDPEYFQTVQLTEKSDVYSFGVVLVELLTGLKPVSFERMKNESNLAIFFLTKMNTNGLLEILDSRLNIEEARYVESMGKVANLAKDCLSVVGEKRPTMKEVVQELLWIRGGPRRNAWMDADVVENQEEMIALLVEEEEPSDGVQHGIATGDLYPMPQGLTVAFSIENFKDSLNRGR